MPVSAWRLLRAPVRKPLPPIQIIDPLEYPGWDKLILAFPNVSFFHSSYWLQVLADTYSYKPLCFCSGLDESSPACIPLLEIKSAITGKRAVSLPFTDYCEPLASEPAQLHELIVHIRDFGSEWGWKYVEFRGGQEFFTAHVPSSQFFGHVLHLTGGAEKLYAAFHGNTRRNIKKALKSGIQIDIGQSPEAVEQYYQLHCITRQRHGAPPQPKRFFNKIYEHVLAMRRGMVVLASYGGKPIAAAVYFHFGRKAIYKFGASDLTYQHLRANDLVMWEAIQWFCENGFETLCFGRTEKSNEGLRRFKNGWSPLEQHINYYRLDLLGKTSTTVGPAQQPWMEAVFRKLPLPILRVIGAAMYKHMG